MGRPPGQGGPRTWSVSQGLRNAARGSSRSTRRLKSGRRSYRGPIGGGVGHEDLAPVGSCLAGGERGLQLDEGALDADRVGMPGEVDGDRCPARTGGSSTDWSAATVRTSLTWSSRPDQARRGRARSGWRRRRGGAGSGTRTGARRRCWGMKPMRKWGSRSHHGPGTPSWAVQLTGSSSMIGMPVDGGRGRPEQLVEELLGVAGDPALDPDLVDRLAPAGEHAHAVAGGGDLVEVLVQGVPCERLRTPAGGPGRQARRPG